MTAALESFQALSFDCYGTLIDWETGIGTVLDEWAARRDLALTHEQLLVAYADKEAAVESEHPGLLYPDVLREAFRRTGSSLGRPVDDHDADALGTSVPDWPAFEDSHEALSRLKEHYKLIIVSNVNRDGFAASNKRLGIDFDKVITAEDVGSYKPSPRHFEALLGSLEATGVTKGALLHVAQSLFHDHVPAKEFGLPSVWINRRHDQPGWGATPEPPSPVTPDWTFNSMAEFADAVDAAFA